MAMDVLRALDPVKRIFQKFSRMSMDKSGMTLWGSALPKTLIVEEHGIKFIVRPKDRTGLFLDQRTQKDDR